MLLGTQVFFSIMQGRSYYHPSFSALFLFLFFLVAQQANKQQKCQKK